MRPVAKLGTAIRTERWVRLPASFLQFSNPICNYCQFLKFLHTSGAIKLPYCNFTFIIHYNWTVAYYLGESTAERPITATAQLTQTNKQTNRTHTQTNNNNNNNSCSSSDDSVKHTSRLQFATLQPCTACSCCQFLPNAPHQHTAMFRPAQENQWSLTEILSKLA
jgi:hypothetical protein